MRASKLKELSMQEEIIEPEPGINTFRIMSIRPLELESTCTMQLSKKLPLELSLFSTMFEINLLIMTDYIFQYISWGFGVLGFWGFSFHTEK